MSYPMFGLFSLVQDSDSDFTFNFEIPDNCSYQVTATSGTYDISVKLNPGQNAPSTTFMSCKENLTTNTKSLGVNISQYEKSGNIIKRPNAGVSL